MEQKIGCGDLGVDPAATFRVTLQPIISEVPADAGLARADPSLAITNRAAALQYHDFGGDR